MIALDTNILVHSHRKDASLHAEAKECIRRLAEGAAPWGICFHSLVEFYGVVSHPKIWADSSTPSQVEDQVAAWRASPSLHILTDAPDDIAELLTIAKASKVIGPMIHDARIASCCLVHGVRELWTVDRDFSRFPNLRTKNPLL